MNERKSFALLALLMLGVVLAMTAVSIGVTYKISMSQHEESLKYLSDIQVHFIEALQSKGINKAQIKQILIDTHKRFKGFGETGEIAIAEYKDNKMFYWVNNSQIANSNAPETVIEFNAPTAQPMSASLKGGEGVLYGRDYRGKNVLAAYHGLGVKNIGVVSKVNTDELLYYLGKLALVILLICLVLTTIVLLLFYKISSPLLTAIIKSREEYKKLSNWLEEKNQEMEQLLYIASHDLRSPLVNIQGFSREINNSIKKIYNVVDEKVSDLDLKNYLINMKSETFDPSFTFIFASVEKMDNLLNGLLKLSRVARNEIVFTSVDMNKLIAGVIKTFEYIIKELDIKINVNHMANCLGDSVLISQVFSNLIDNAIKYRDKNRKLIINISSTEDSDSDSYIYSIGDNGQGISEKYHAKIFELFQRLDTSEKGEGLGLTIISKIISKHFGKVWVSSNVDDIGVTFYFSIPKRKG